MTWVPGRIALLAIGVTGLAGLALGACAAPGPVAENGSTASTSALSGQPAPSASAVAPSASPTPSATPSPLPTPPPIALSPLDGSPLDASPGGGPRPVLVVKLDNTRNAQPHAGLNRADVVYVEEVEYGITRLAAVFSEHVPTRIGPVRSARITDIDLLAQYRRPAFAYSGAQGRMYPLLDAARFYDVSPRRGAQGYSRDYGRRAPYNYFLDGRIGLDRAPEASKARDIGFTFADTIPAGGLLARRAEMAWGASSAAFRYDPDSGRYRVWLNGEPARAEEHDRGQQAATVVIQYVRQTPSRFNDRDGGNTPHAHTIGSGKAIVLRDGQAWRVRWSRPGATDGTTFTLPDGSPLPFKPGQVWVVLLDRERTAVVRPLTPADVPGPSASPSSTANPGPQ